MAELKLRPTPDQTYGNQTPTSDRMPPMTI